MDIRTLFVMTVVNSLLLGTAQLIVWRTRREHPSLLLWGLANFVGAAGSLLIAARGLAPDWASIGVGNGLIIGWLMLLWDGTRRFDGLQLSLGWVIGVSGAVTVAMLVPPLSTNLAARAMAIGALNGVLLTLVTIDLMRVQRRDPLMIRRFLIVVFVIAAVPCYVRVVLSAGLDRQGDFMASGPVQAAMMLHMNLFILAWNIGGLLMFNERMQNILGRAATIDALTGLPNGNEFLTRAERLLHRARIADQPLALLMIGLRHLRSYNVRLGNVGAEASIRSLAQTLSAQVRPNELVAYLGAEQFAVLIENCDLTAAQGIAERLATAIDHQNIPHPGTPRGVARALIGLCAGPAHSFASARTLCEYADAALLRLNQTGEQRIATLLPPIRYANTAV